MEREEEEKRLAELRQIEDQKRRAEEVSLSFCFLLSAVYNIELPSSHLVYVLVKLVYLL